MDRWMDGWMAMSHPAEGLTIDHLQYQGLFLLSECLHGEFERPKRNRYGGRRREALSDSSRMGSSLGLRSRSNDTEISLDEIMMRRRQITWK